MIPQAAEHVTLVDEEDRVIGMAEKLSAHRGEGLLHRAFSVFIFHEDGRMLLQRRSPHKYHFRGLWSNACCGHPRMDEDVGRAARRRLEEELGFSTMLEQAFTFLYRATDAASGFTEYELDHVMVGVHSGDPHPNPLEVDAWKWLPMDLLLQDVRVNKSAYTPWFPIALARLSAERNLGRPGGA